LQKFSSAELARILTMMAADPPPYEHPPQWIPLQMVGTTDCFYRAAWNADAV